MRKKTLQIIIFCLLILSSAGCIKEEDTITDNNPQNNNSKFSLATSKYFYINIKKLHGIKRDSYPILYQYLNMLMERVSNSTVLKNNIKKFKEIAITHNYQKITNAKCLGNGYFIIDLEFLSGIKNEEALMGILAHEYGHFEALHEESRYMNLTIPKSLCDSFSIIVNNMAGSNYRIHNKRTNNESLIKADRIWKSCPISNLQSKKNEYQADSISLEILTDLNYSVTGLIYFLLDDSMHDDTPSTHPIPRDRISRLTSYPIYKKNQTIKPEKGTNLDFSEFKYRLQICRKKLASSLK